MYDGEICEDCGLPVALGIGGTWWEASDSLWETITGKEDGSGILCPRCFTIQARALGTHVHWKAMLGA